MTQRQKFTILITDDGPPIDVRELEGILENHYDYVEANEVDDA